VGCLWESASGSIKNDLAQNGNYQEFKFKLKQKILERLNEYKIPIKYSIDEMNPRIGKKDLKYYKRKLNSNNNSLEIDDFCYLATGHRLDKDISDKNLLDILKALTDKKVFVSIILDNLDSFAYTDERYMFLDGDGFEDFNIGVNKVKRVIKDLDMYAKVVSITYALRPYVLTHLISFNLGNIPQGTLEKSIVYQIKSQPEITAKQTMESRILLFEALMNKLKFDENDIRQEFGHLKEKFNTLKTNFQSNIKGSDVFEKFYNISTQGYRSIIRFFELLPLHPDLFERYLTSSDILLLYKLGLRKKYSQIIPPYVGNHSPANVKYRQGFTGKNINYPNIFLVVSNAGCNEKYDNACIPNTITFWLKYNLLSYVKSNNNVSMSGILNDFCGNENLFIEGYYEPHLVKLAIGSLGTVNEYNCIEYNFSDIQQLNTVHDLYNFTIISSTNRGDNLINSNELFDIGTLQFLLEDWLLPKPIISKLIEHDLKFQHEISELFSKKTNYEYLIDKEEYIKKLKPFMHLKVKQSIWFLTILEITLKYEKILYRNVYDNINFEENMDENFFLKKKEKIIERVQDHILKSYYSSITKEEKAKETIELENFLNRCREPKVKNGIKSFFENIYGNKIKIICSAH